MSKLTAYAALARSALRHDDLLLAVDVHDTSMASSGTDKKLAVGALRPGNVFWLDDYGADPTGAALSDAAFTAALADAAAAVLTHSGAMLVLGAGTYLFTPGTVAITDGRIGFRGAGRSATTVKPGAGTGSLLKFSAVSAGDGAGSAPVGGFTAYGWATASAVNGVEYGDRPNGCLADVTVTGFNGAAGSRGFWFRDTADLSEGSFVVANADQNTVNYDFDAGSGAGSFDYSHFYLHLVCTTAGGSSAVGLRMVNNMHCNGGVIHLAGNISATAGLTATVLQVGASTSDTCHIQGTRLDVMVEADTSAGTVKDVLIQGVSSNAGIVHCNGTMFFQNASGSYTAGTVTSPAVFTTAGFLVGPTFSGHGTLTAVGTGGAFSTYSG